MLVSTRAGTEGLNLQFCHQLVNYELPWNPMVVEQRIGRVHRYGQTREVELFNACDIGVYPLDDDDWSRGKCGFKAIQFMACGVPVVAAAVGVNREIIRDGENGFLASSPQEWREKLARLLTDAPLRERFSRAGRQTIEERYSLRVTAPQLAAVLRQAVSEPT